MMKNRLIQVTNVVESPEAVNKRASEVVVSHRLLRIIVWERIYHSLVLGDRPIRIEFLSEPLKAQNKTVPQVREQCQLIGVTLRD